LRIDGVIAEHGAPFRAAGDALDRARRRLDSFIADPIRHTRYATKVLIKFHLLEARQCGIGELLKWFVAARYVQVNHDLHFANTIFR
jgi:hypothetical protein